MISVKITLKDDTLKKLTSRSKWNKYINLVLTNIGNEAVREIRLIANSGIFKNPTGNYSKKIYKTVEKTKLTVWSDVPYANALEHGFKDDRPMTWLLNKGPITFTTSDGTKIIRRLSSMNQIGRPADNKSGKSWTYPAKPGLYIFKKGMEKAIKVAQQQLNSQLLFQIIEE